MSQNSTLHCYQPYHPTNLLSLTPFASVAIRNEATGPSGSSNSTSSYRSSKYGHGKPTVKNALGVSPLFSSCNLYSSGDLERHSTWRYAPSWLFHRIKLWWKCVQGTVLFENTYDRTNPLQLSSTSQRRAQTVIEAWAVTRSGLDSRFGKDSHLRPHDQARFHGVTSFLSNAYQQLFPWR
jgi:hypothetical protein